MYDLLSCSCNYFEFKFYTSRNVRSLLLVAMSSQVEKVLKIYHTLAKVPSITGAKILKGGRTIVSKWSQRNLERKTSSKIAYNYYMDGNLQVVYESDVGLDVSNESLTTYSSSELFKAVIREQSESNDTKKQYLEIWQSRYLNQCIDLAALEIHGDVYCDAEFGSLEWSPDEKCVAYIAEKKLPKSEPFYKRKPIKSKKEDNSGESSPIIGNEFEYKQDWGEQLVGKHLSVIVVCNLENETFTIIQGLPESWCPAQVLWAPDGKSLVGVAWETEPRRLGLKFCTNRPSVIFNVTLDGNYSVLSEENVAPISPRFSPDNNQLLWLQRPIKGTHHGCMQLISSAWPVGDKPNVQVIVDKVMDHVVIENKEKFYGIYCTALPASGFTADSKRLIFTTPQQNELRTYILNLSNQKLTHISDTSMLCSTTVLDVRADLILAVRSSANRPHQLIMAHVPKEGEESSIKWHSIGNVISVPQEITDMKIEYLDLKHRDSEDAVDSFTAIFVGPGNMDEKAVPLIVTPHGGPHSCFANSYSLETAFFGMLGFAVLKVNYRGSTGQGEASVISLLTHNGKNDCDDCMLATSTAANLFPIQTDKTVLFGGSYGGYIVLTLSGIHPSIFAAVAARNPVTNMVAKYSIADIPDVCAVESGHEFTEEGPMDEELFLAMRKVSPIIHAHKVRAPTILMLGTNDKRVPLSQGLEYYHRLKANGCKAKVHMYADNHSLSSVTIEMDHIINSVLWFLEHTQSASPKK